MPVKRDRKRFEEWANKELAKWQTILLLNDHTLSSIKASNKPASECYFRYPYKDIQITYSEDVYKDWKEGRRSDAIEILIHELCHVFTDPLYAKAGNRYVSKREIEDERERLTDHVANIIIKNLCQQ